MNQLYSSDSFVEKSAVMGSYPADSNDIFLNRHLETVLGAMSEGVLGVVFERIVFATSVAAELLGKTPAELHGLMLSDFFEPQYRSLLRTFLCNHPTDPTVFGQDFPVELGGRQITFRRAPLKDDGETTLLFISDVTKQKQIERQLRQSQKMEAIGTLAGGIAHDFNNILAAIMGYAEIVKFDLDATHPAHQKIDQILIASNRAKDLIHQILAFSRQSEIKRKPVQMHLIVKEALKLLRASLPSSIEIRQNILVESSHVMADATQIHQLLMNLCTNAHHAMRATGGILEVTIQTVAAADLELSAHEEMRQGAYLRLSIADSGIGMDRTVMDRIFEPYFTTKPKGEGTGMGLAVVHGIVKSHGGAITVHSQPGQGTVFHVYFPLVVIDEKPAGYEAADLPRGTEQILLVDDEEVLVNLGRQMLELLGYQVECRTSSVEALEAFRSNPDHFDLLITDMTMPNMSGERLAQKILAIKPDLPVLLCTGFSESITPEKAAGVGIKALLMKPLALFQLAQVIRTTLDQTQNEKATGRGKPS